MTGKALIRHRSEVPGVPCPCGTSVRVLTQSENDTVSFHVTTIQDSARHYHKTVTEVYYILRGTGKIELDGVEHDVRPEHVIFIPPMVRHRLIADEEIDTIVVAVPPFDADDEWFD